MTFELRILLVIGYLDLGFIALFSYFILIIISCILFIDYRSMSQRITKLNKLIQSHLGEIFQRELSLKPGVFVTIAKVDTTPDIRYTRVSLSVFPFKDSDYVLKTIGKEKYDIQGALNRKLAIKPLPRLVFQIDETEEKADEIEKILLQI